METIPASALDIFHRNARILITGYSDSGKSVLTKSLIEKYSSKFDRIITVGATYTGSDKIKRDDDFDPLLNKINGSTLVVYDDILLERKLVQTAASAYIKARHTNTSCIFISQSLFHSCKFYRTIVLNCTHVFLLRLRDLRQLEVFGRTFLNRIQIETFIKVYKKFVIKKQYGHILIDFTKDFENKLAIRTNTVGADKQIAIKF